MKSSAHIQAVIELIDAVLAKPTVPADQILHHYCRMRRYMGSSDRRAIGNLFYSVLRQWPLLEFFSSTINGRLAVLIYAHCCDRNIFTLLDGDTFGPSRLTTQEEKFLKSISLQDVPLFVQAGCPASVWADLCEWGEDEAIQISKSMQVQAPFDVRINPLKTSREKVLDQFKKQNLDCVPTPYSPLGLRFKQRIDLGQNVLFKQGLVEVQDEGSQLVGLLCDAKPGMRVMDFCAGAGGKSLVLAASMANKGTLVLSDIYPKRLANAQERLKRAGGHNYRVQVLPDAAWLKRHAGTFDRVLVDVPCSGTGTWRRNPDLKMKFNQDDLLNLLVEQKKILSQAARLIKPGGGLIYATCSVLKRENHHQVAEFLKNNPDFDLVDLRGVWTQQTSMTAPFDASMLQLFPHQHQTDGFFVAYMERRFENQQV